MNRARSIFITGYLLLATGLAGLSAWKILAGADPMGWSGVLLVSAPILLLIAWLMLRKNVARTGAHLPGLQILALSGTGLAAYSYLMREGESLPLLLALAGTLSLYVYLYWYSRFDGRKPSPRLAVGARLPSFTLRRVGGGTIASSELLDRPAILLFFRGNWCPLCMAQIREIAGMYREISALGVRVALISPQPHGNTESLARSYDVDFDFLTDEGGKAARTLGIAHEDGLPMGMQALGYASDTVLPTVVITGRGGTILWTHETDNYRVRPEPGTFLEIMKQHGIVAAA